MTVRAGPVLACFLGLLIAAASLPSGLGAVTSELVVADRRAGVALFGFDPVSYFVDGSARKGSQMLVVSFGGWSWHFRNEGNRAAFLDRPDTYLPQFGGYDPIELARGAPVAGHPLMFGIHGGQLFLFHRPENQNLFLAESEDVIVAARSAWPAVRRMLVP